MVKLLGRCSEFIARREALASADVANVPALASTVILLLVVARAVLARESAELMDQQGEVHGRDEGNEARDPERGA